MKSVIFLFCLSFSFAIWGLEEDDVSLIESYDLIEGPIAKNQAFSSSQSASPKNFDQYRFRDQPRNTTRWESLDEQDWFDINKWIKKQQAKSKLGDQQWHKRWREETNFEVVARVLKCLGACEKYQGIKRVKTEFRSALRAGDEFRTGKHSYAWIFLMNGALIKLLPESSITLHELDFSKQESFAIIRLNEGYLNYLSRFAGKFDSLNKTESDLSMYPLKVLKANREFFMRGESSAEKKSLADELIHKNPGHKAQYTYLNKLISENTKFLKNKKSKFFIYTSNASFYAGFANFEIFYQPTQSTYARYTSSHPNFQNQDSSHSFAKINLRGYQNTEKISLKRQQWYKVDPTGRKIEELEATDKNISKLEAVSHFLLRIPTIHLAREIWIKKYLKPFYAKEINSQEFAVKFGRRLWNEFESDELKKRLEYAYGYIRRVETTNLKVIKKYFPPKAYSGDFLKSYFSLAMYKHYTKLKNRLNDKYMKIPFMTAGEYYAWVLRNG
ncbi:MAG: hypothetical protein QF441_07415 [Bacteriovoracaceae bacterium]|jgi:hypothetical protein|nr:hypothetical protein [Bacteriovoracaceae bacterium]